MIPSYPGIGRLSQAKTMPHSKKQKLSSTNLAPTAGIEEGRSNDISSAAKNDEMAFNNLGTDEIANIFAYLTPKDIMLARQNKNMRDAAKKTIVPMAEFSVNTVCKYNAMRAMTTALPNLTHIELQNLLPLSIQIDGELQPITFEHKYRDGEDRYDPYWQLAASEVNHINHNVEIISNFRKLRSLRICGAPLNGRYHSLFNFPLLQYLTISNSHTSIRWDLEVLSGFPLLKELRCGDHCNNYIMTGNINSLRVLKDTLELVNFHRCSLVQGNFMDLADFPRLKELDLFQTAVIGDVRDVGERDFVTLETLTLPSGVYGGCHYEFERISDAPDVISALYSLKKQRPSLLLKYWRAKLSEDSPDWYEGMDIYDQRSSAPIFIAFVQAGSRVGYRWETERGAPCEAIWLDPEPGQESSGSDYEQYIEELRTIEQQTFYRGFHQPPTEDEYYLVWETVDGCEDDYYPD